MTDVLKLLESRDLRSVEHAESLVRYIGTDATRFNEIFEYMFAPVQTVAMAASDVIERVSGARPELLKPHKRTLLRRLSEIEQKEVRWHVAQILSRVPLTEREALAVAEILKQWLLSDASGIVKVFSLQTIVDLAQRYPAIDPIARACATWGDEHGKPAMRARLRILRKKGLL